MSMIKVEYFKHTDTIQDFADIARVSFARKSNEFTHQQNVKLCKYLKDHNHWTAFGHNRIIVDIKHFSDQAIVELMTLKPELKASMVFEEIDYKYRMSNSTWGWFQFLAQASDSMKSYLTPVVQKLNEFGLNINSDCGLIDFRPIIVSDFDMNHTAISFRCSAPIFVARQLGKSQVQFCWNEESRRYISTDPEFYIPDNFRIKPEGSIKQGSGEMISGDQNDWYRIEQKEHHLKCLTLYKRWLNEDVAPEIARSVLPQSTMVNWIWTSTLNGWKRVLEQRLDPHAQYETRLFAEQLQSELKRLEFLK